MKNKLYFYLKHNVFKIQEGTVLPTYFLIIRFILFPTDVWTWYLANKARIRQDIYMDGYVIDDVFISRFEIMERKNNPDATFTLK